MSWASVLGVAPTYRATDHLDVIERSSAGKLCVRWRTAYTCRAQLLRMAGRSPMQDATFGGSKLVLGCGLLLVRSMRGTGFVVLLVLRWCVASLQLWLHSSELRPLLELVP